MFNKTFLTVQEASRGPSHVTVHEHRAPTDESARLYGELLKKARAEIIETIAAPHNNVLSHAKVETQYRIASMEHEFFVVFKLNGETHKIKIDVEDGTREAMVRAITYKLCKEIGRSLERELPRLVKA